MNSDQARRLPDVKFKPVGSGLSQTFLCAACVKYRLIPGRRLKRVNGLKTWVCRECAA